MQRHTHTLARRKEFAAATVMIFILKADSYQIQVGSDVQRMDLYSLSNGPLTLLKSVSHRDRNIIFRRQYLLYIYIYVFNPTANESTDFLVLN